jgi:hypothetical protein
MSVWELLGCLLGAVVFMEVMHYLIDYRFPRWLAVRRQKRA